MVGGGAAGRRARRCLKSPFIQGRITQQGCGPLDVHDLGFFPLAHLLHAADLVVGELLHLVECALFFIL